jgi:hypothetical protein
MLKSYVVQRELPPNPGSSLLGGSDCISPPMQPNVIMFQFWWQHGKTILIGGDVSKSLSVFYHEAKFEHHSHANLL